MTEVLTRMRTAFDSAATLDQPVLMTNFRVRHQPSATASAAFTAIIRAEQGSGTYASKPDFDLASEVSTDLETMMQNAEARQR